MRIKSKYKKTKQKLYATILTFLAKNSFKTFCIVSHNTHSHFNKQVILTMLFRFNHLDSWVFHFFLGENCSKHQTRESTQNLQQRYRASYTSMERNSWTSRNNFKKPLTLMTKDQQTSVLIFIWV